MEMEKVISEVIGIQDDLKAQCHSSVTEGQLLIAAAIIQQSSVMIGSNEGRDKMVKQLMGVLDFVMPIIGFGTGSSKVKFCSQNLKSCTDFKNGVCIKKDKCEFQQDKPDLG